MGLEKHLAHSYSFKPPNYIGIREYFFTTKNGEEYSVQFVKKEKKGHCFLIDFSLTDSDKDEYFTTNSDDIFRKMATLIAIMLDFVAKNPHCTCIEFVPINEDEKSSNRRKKLFSRYAHIFSSISGWSYSIHEDTFTLQKPKEK